MGKYKGGITMSKVQTHLEKDDLKKMKEELKFLKSQYEDMNGYFGKALQLLVNVYQRPSEPGVRSKVKEFLSDFEIDPTETGI